jgi:hypothetical protein
MDLRGPLEKISDTDFLPQMIGSTAQWRMELEVVTLTGATRGRRNADRLIITHRNGYRERKWDTALERLSCAYRVRKGLLLPRPPGDATDGQMGRRR